MQLLVARQVSERLLHSACPNSCGCSPFAYVLTRSMPLLALQVKVSTLQHLNTLVCAGGSVPGCGRCGRGCPALFSQHNSSQGLACGFWR